MEAAMIRGASKKSCRSEPFRGLRVTNPHVAGIDVHAKEHWVAVSPEDALPARVDQPAHPAAARPQVWHLHGGPGNAGGLVAGLWSDQCGHGIDGGLLDCAV